MATTIVAQSLGTKYLLEARALDGIQVMQDGQRVSVKITESDELAGTLVSLLLK